MNLIENVSRNLSRRSFLQTAAAAGAFVLSARFISQPLWAEGTTAAQPLDRKSVV